MVEDKNGNVENEDMSQSQRYGVVERCWTPGWGKWGPTEVAGSNPGLGCALSILSLVLGVGGGSAHSPLAKTTQTQWNGLPL